MHYNDVSNCLIFCLLVWGVGGGGLWQHVYLGADISWIILFKSNKIGIPQEVADGQGQQRTERR